jgi:myosin-5
MATPSLSQQLGLYSEGTKVWWADDKEGWVSASCLKKQVGDRVTMVFQNDEDSSKVRTSQPNKQCDVMNLDFT